jgi:4-hydroxymandelate oxidase
MVTSTTATTALGDVMAASPGPMWFQLYLYQDRGKSRALIEEAVRAGYTGVVLTVDAPVLGRRERDIRSGFTLPKGLTIANAAVAGMHIVPEASDDASGLMLHFRSLHDAGLTPKDVTWVRDVSGLPVIVKGIVRGDDAVRAVEHGAQGIVVSNHGGRQLDTAALFGTYSRPNGARLILFGARAAQDVQLTLRGALGGGQTDETVNGFVSNDTLYAVFAATQTQATFVRRP